MKVPIISEVLGCCEEIMGLINNAEERKRTRCIRSADALISKLDGVDLPKEAQHYYNQYKIRRERLT